VETIKTIKLGETGFSLVEILITLMITGLLSTAVLGLLSSLSQWIYDARQSSIASCYGALVMASLRDNRQLLDDDLTGQNAIDLDLPGIPSDQGVVATVTHIHRREPDSNLYDVSVDVAWRFGDNHRSLQLSTIIRKE